MASSAQETAESRPQEDSCSTSKSRTLLVRHLPTELSYEDKQDLLKRFGAVSVRVFSDKGRLKHTAFATFSNENLAAKALSRLHQLTLCGHPLVVEFAKEQDHVQLLDQPSYSEEKKSTDDDEEKDVKESSLPSIEIGIAPSHGLTFPINSCLKYHYPPPSTTILSNIANTLACVPKFYVQVLHLMNKMNLPTPFGLPTPTPPLEPPLPEEEEFEIEISSREESEYESGEEEEKERISKLMELATFQPKRLRATKQPRVRKKPKIKDLMSVGAVVHASKAQPTDPSDVFEQTPSLGPKKIEFHISTDLPAIPRKESNNDLPATSGELSTDGFGKIFPTLISESKEEQEANEDNEMPSKFISRSELDKSRIPSKEMAKHSVFKKYEPGEPNCRIYVKNLSKQVEVKDLKFIFGRYIDFSSETESIMFDVRLMKEGRMKGQAFIGLPSENAAAKALKEVNGYVLHDRPMVVQFARSARPKENSKEGQKKSKTGGRYEAPCCT